jgi:ribonuclease D
VNRTLAHDQHHLYQIHFDKPLSYTNCGMCMTMGRDGVPPLPSPPPSQLLPLPPSLPLSSISSTASSIDVPPSLSFQQLCDVSIPLPRGYRFDKPILARLPLFEGLSLRSVTWCRTLSDMERACKELLFLPVASSSGDHIGQVIFGFDTESRPLFEKGSRSVGAHLFQVSTLTHAYLFPISGHIMPPSLRTILESSSILKVGIGLASDHKLLSRNYKLTLRNTHDISTSFEPFGYGHQAVGTEQAVAIVFRHYYRKTKKVQMSNWSLPILTNAQLSYAANDAFVALRLYYAMETMKARPMVPLVALTAPSTSSSVSVESQQHRLQIASTSSVRATSTISSGLLSTTPS